MFNLFMGKKFKMGYVLMLACLYSCNANAVYTNYYGVVKRIAFIDDLGSFVVTVDSASLDNCKYKYAYFRSDKIGQERVKMAYSMALTSITTKMKMNFVIDKDINGVDGICYVGGMAAGIQSY